MPDSTPTFETHRDRLLRLAYGMLGRVSRAKDVVQDAYLRWRDVDPERVDEPEAYLSTIVTRLCLDELNSARAARERYTGPWLPEPVVATDDVPDAALETEGELSMALMVLLDNLTPIERAVYVLREALGWPYARIARLVDRSEAHCRKIAQRARTRIDQQGPPTDGRPAVHSDLLERFVAAIEAQDGAALAEVLAEDATHYADGGEVKEAAKRPIRGADRVVRFLLSVSEKAPDDLEPEPTQVNGLPGLLVRQDDRIHSVWALRVGGGKIQDVYCVRNPEKLRHLARPPVE